MISKIVSIVGLGYVGMPLAIAFSKHFKVIGFDINPTKVKSQMNRYGSRNLELVNNPKRIRESDFIIICVPTPVNKFKEPDLSYVISAAEIVGDNLKKRAIVVLESTVYPGVTEEVVKPILEIRSGLKCGKDFKVGYSPERINPGDKQHSIDKIVKIVAGMDEKATNDLAELYGHITDVFIAKDIKTAEAAKVIENIQRDINIALMNELALIFVRMGIDTKAILDAASTKWNFINFTPGLVGGHCIPVDPYYLVYKAKELNYHPKVILAGREVNDYMPKYVAELAIKGINEADKTIRNSRVLIMGLTYKEDVPDIRSSPAREIVRELKEYNVNIYGYDPLLTEEEIRDFDVLCLRDDLKMDCIIIAVGHEKFRKIGLETIIDMMKEKPVLIDVRGIFEKNKLLHKDIIYRKL
jgi:UDP-N-acetyl-D-galactosamine dehydrogenase